MMALSEEDIKTIVALVGRDGAVAALISSDKIQREDLVELASSLTLQVKTGDSKKKIAQELIRHVDKRITKSLDDLKKMTKEQLISYFRDVQCDSDDLIKLLNSIDIESRAKSKGALIEFAAIQISSLGVFERISE